MTGLRGGPERVPFSNLFGPVASCMQPVIAEVKALKEDLPGISNKAKGIQLQL
ncbi:hypothetical protein SAMN02787142_8078 [Burkholderia sp. WP9]|nr:hypothetical protein SAMN02787142_8078 [Burkholderia sp. WP9]